MTRLQALLLRTAVAARLGAIPTEDYVDLDRAVDGLLGTTDRDLLEQVDRVWIQICNDSEVRVFAGAA